jgi:SAM-dependent methyltransferase
VPGTDQPFDPTAFDAAAYGRFAARDYDELYAELDPSAAVETLADLADGGPVVEFGVGTGRLALPLARRGLVIHGIDGSPEMADLLQRKPGGKEIPVVIGDFSEVTAGTDFGLVILAINTIYALPSQEAQVACFRNAARHLRPGGRFVVEAWVPDVGAFRNGTAVRPVQIHDSHVELEIARLHSASQMMFTSKVHISDGVIRLIPANHRYAWPNELDLMAQLAGMRLAYRWQDWERTPFHDASTTHISVWEKLPAGSLLLLCPARPTTRAAMPHRVIRLKSRPLPCRRRRRVPSAEAMRVQQFIERTVG